MFILSHYEKAPITIHETDVWWYSVYNQPRYRGFNHTKATLSVGECWYPGQLVQLSIPDCSEPLLRPESGFPGSGTQPVEVPVLI